MWFSATCRDRCLQGVREVAWGWGRGGERCERFAAINSLGARGSLEGMHREHFGSGGADCQRPHKLIRSCTSRLPAGTGAAGAALDCWQPPRTTRRPPWTSERPPRTVDGHPGPKTIALDHLRSPQTRGPAALTPDQRQTPGAVRPPWTNGAHPGAEATTLDQWRPPQTGSSHPGPSVTTLDQLQPPRTSGTHPGPAAATPEQIQPPRTSRLQPCAQRAL